MLSSFLNIFIVRPYGSRRAGVVLLVIKSVVSFRGTFVNSDSMSNEAIVTGCEIFRSHISLTKEIEFSIVYWFVVKGVIICTTVPSLEKRLIGTEKSTPVAISRLLEY